MNDKKPFTESNPRGAGRKKIIADKVLLQVSVEREQKEWVLKNGGASMIRKIIDDLMKKHLQN